MTLGEAQRIFAFCVGRLLARIYASGYACTFGETYRSDEQAVINSLGEAGRSRVADLVKDEFPALAIAVSNNGKANGILMSVHRQRLAIDINLFKDGQYLSDGHAHAIFGSWWEEQHPLARWGGHFGDGNHYSFEWQGRK